MYGSRFPLTRRNAENLLHERGIDICHESIRFWVDRFDPIFAHEIKRRRSHAMHQQTQWRCCWRRVRIRLTPPPHGLAKSAKRHCQRGWLRARFPGAGSGRRCVRDGFRQGLRAGPAQELTLKPGCGRGFPYGSGEHWTTSLPRFLPVNSRSSAAGAFSSPCTISVSKLILPAWTHSDRACSPSGKRSM